MRLIQKDNGRIVALFAIVAVFAIITTAYVVTESDGATGDLFITNPPSDQYIDGWSNATYVVEAVSTAGPITYTWTVDEFGPPETWVTVTKGEGMGTHMLVVSPSDYDNGTRFKCVVSNGSTTIELGPYNLNVSTSRTVHYVNNIEDLYKVGKTAEWLPSHTYIQTDDIDFTTAESEAFLQSPAGGNKTDLIRIDYEVFPDRVQFRIYESSDSGSNWSELTSYLGILYRFGDDPAATVGSSFPNVLQDGIYHVRTGVPGQPASGYTGEHLMFIIARNDANPLVASVEIDVPIPSSGSVTGSKISYRLGNFETIGSGSINATVFSGVYDGDNHVIIGLETAAYGATAMFHCGIGTSSPLIKNLGLVGGSSTATASAGRFFAAASTTVRIVNCFNTGTVASANGIAGGISSGGGPVLNCYNTGTVFGATRAGGILGSVDAAPVYASHNSGYIRGGNIAGGIVGEYESGANPRAVSDCYNTGSVRAQDNAGGIIGSAFGEVVVNIIRCYNTGDVTAAGLNTTNKFSRDAGGILGAVETLTRVIPAGGTLPLGTITISESFNKGKISATSDINDVYLSVGGIVGSMGSNLVMTNCYNDGDVELIKTGASSIADFIAQGGLVGSDFSRNNAGVPLHYGTVTMTKSYNAGTMSLDLTGYAGNIRSGPVVGHTDGRVYTLTDVFYLNTCVTSPTNTYGVSIDQIAMRNPSTFTSVGWDFSLIWGNDSTNSINSGYPAFKRYLSPPVIAEHPLTQIKGVNDTAVFSVKVVDKEETVTIGGSPTIVKSGNGYSYQWQQKLSGGIYIDIPGAESPDLVIQSVASGQDDAMYKCIITTVYGVTGESAEAELKVYTNVFRVTTEVAKDDGTLGTGGYIYESGFIDVQGGTNKTFTFTTRPNFMLLGINVTPAGGSTTFTQASSLPVNGGGDRTYTFTSIADNYTLEAVFSEFYTVTVVIEGGGNVQLQYTTTAGNPVTETATGTGTHTFDVLRGAVVTATAQDASPALFSYWTSTPTVTSPLNRTAVFTPTGNVEIDAYFGRQVTFIADGFIASDKFTVTVDGYSMGEAVNGTNLQVAIPDGSTIELVASSQFTYWAATNVTLADYGSASTTATMGSTTATVTGYFGNLLMIVAVDGYSGDNIVVKVNNVSVGSAVYGTNFTRYVRNGNTVEVAASTNFSYWTATNVTLADYGVATTTTTVGASAPTITGYFGNLLMTVAVDGYSGDSIAVKVNNVSVGTAIQGTNFSWYVRNGNTVEVAASAHFTYWTATNVTLVNYGAITTTATVGASAPTITGYFGVTEMTVSVDGSTVDSVAVTIEGISVGTATSTIPIVRWVRVGYTIGLSASSNFSYWTGTNVTIADTGDPITTASVTAALPTITGRFGVDQLTVTVDGFSGDTITVSVNNNPVGVATLSTPLIRTVNVGDIVEVTASSNFSYWTGNGVTFAPGGTGTSPTTVTVNNDTAAIVGYFGDTPLTVTVDGFAGDTIAVSIQGVSVGTATSTIPFTRMVRVSDAIGLSASVHFSYWTGTNTTFVNEGLAATTATVTAATPAITGHFGNTTMTVRVDGFIGDTIDVEIGGVSVGTATNTTPLTKWVRVSDTIGLSASAHFAYWTAVNTSVTNLGLAATTATVTAALPVVTGNFGNVEMTVTVDGAAGDTIAASIQGTLLGTATSTTPATIWVRSTYDITVVASANFSYWTGSNVNIASPGVATTTVRATGANPNVVGHFGDTQLTVTVDGFPGDTIAVSIQGVSVGTANYTTSFTRMVRTTDTIGLSASVHFSYWTATNATVMDLDLASTTVTITAAASVVTGYFGNVQVTVITDGEVGTDSISVEVQGVYVGTAEPSLNIVRWVRAGDIISLEANPSTRFFEWVTSLSLSSSTHITDATMSASNATITGLFAVTIMYDIGPFATGTTPPNSVGGVGTNFIAPPVGDLDYPGYVLRGWSNNMGVMFAPGGTYQFRPEYNGQIFTALWVVEDDTRGILIWFEKGPATGTDPLPVYGQEGSKFNAPSVADLEYPGHSLTGWRSGDVTLIPGNEYVLLRSYDLRVFEAVWTGNPYTVKVTVAGGGGTAVPPLVTVPSGGSVTIVINPDGGYTLSTVTDNGRRVSVVDAPNRTHTYTITGIQEDHNVTVTFDNDNGLWWWWIILLIILILILIALIIYFSKKFDVVKVTQEQGVIIEGEDKVRRGKKYVFTITGTAYDYIQYRIGEDGEVMKPLLGPDGEYIIPGKEVKGDVIIEVL